MPPERRRGSEQVRLGRVADDDQRFVVLHSRFAITFRHPPILPQAPDCGASIATGVRCPGGPTDLRHRERIRRHLHACVASGGCRRTRSRATCSAGSCRGGVPPTYSSRTAPASTSTSGVIRSTPRRNATRSRDLVAHDKAGERILEGLVESAEERLTEEGIRGDIYLFKNNTDSAGNSYGCHENYLVGRQDDFQRTIDTLIPFFVSRQIYAGAGKLLHTARGTVYSTSQRAEHIWEGSSSATTRSRPIINTRDEPHADAERYRRLHVIAGDSNMSEYVTYAKVGTTAALLQMLEDDVVFRDMTLENPIRAIREIAHDTSCRRLVRLANGRELSALDIQWEFLERTMRYARTSGFPPEVDRAIGMWEHLLTGLEKDPMTLSREVDWVAKLHLLDRYAAKHDLPMSSPRMSLARSGIPRRQPTARPLLHPRAPGPRRSGRDRRTNRRGDDPAAVDDEGALAGRLHQGGESQEPGLHRRLGPPEAQRSGAADDPVQGPVPSGRRKGRETDRLAVASRSCRRSSSASSISLHSCSPSTDRSRRRRSGTPSPDTIGTATRRSTERSSVTRISSADSGFRSSARPPTSSRSSSATSCTTIEYALADPGLTDEERTALALAVQAVGFGGRPSGQEALMKLGGAVGSLEGTELGADLGDQADTVALAFAAISERRRAVL